MGVRYTAGADTGFVIENSEELAASVREATNAGAEAAAARAVLVADPLPLASTSAASDSVVISVPDSLYGAPPPAESLPSYEEEPAAVPQMVMDASFNFAVDEEEHQFE